MILTYAAEGEVIPKCRTLPDDLTTETLRRVIWRLYRSGAQFVDLVKLPDGEEMER